MDNYNNTNPLSPSQQDFAPRMADGTYAVRGVGGTYGAGGFARADDVVVYGNTAEVPPPAKRRVKLIGVVAIVMAAVILAMAAGGAAVWYTARNYPEMLGRTIGVNGANPKTSGLFGDVPGTAAVSGAPIPQNLITNNLVAASSHTYTRPDLYDAVSDTVVSIKLTQTITGGNGYGYAFGSGGGAREEKTDVVGSGVIFTTDGYVLTNNHVVEGATKVYAVVTETDPADRTKFETNEYEAKVIGRDDQTDLAVLKITRAKVFRAAPIGNSDTLRVGQDVAAIGNPMGMEKSMTAGIVSGLHRDVGGAGGYSLSSIQTDAAINPGNSGCPLFDMNGNVVGIVNIKYTYNDVLDNMGFAITINEAKPVINELISGGKITDRPVLGIKYQPLTDQLRGYLGVEDIQDGLYVVSVDQPGEGRTELLRGDIIVKAEGTAVTSAEEIQKLIRDKKAGDSIKLTVYRLNDYGKGENKDITLRLISSS
ncbi:hypothetical protein FACS1894133_1300 [Clostridia bacterium]|nr:hypothetical protein FACS1894133_1300 [Clostridia bacterium]